MRGIIASFDSDVERWRRRQLTAPPPEIPQIPARLPPHSLRVQLHHIRCDTGIGPLGTSSTLKELRFRCRKRDQSGTRIKARCLVRLMSMSVWLAQLPCSLVVDLAGRLS
jgi:hypothetical protein